MTSKFKQSQPLSDSDVKMDPVPCGRGLEGLPDIPLLKIANYLDSNSLLALSQTSSKLYRKLSPNEYLWSQKLATERITTGLLPRNLERTHNLRDVLPTCCLSKRLLLVKKRLQKNLKTGCIELTKRRFQGKNPRLVVMNY